MPLLVLKGASSDELEGPPIIGVGTSFSYVMDADSTKDQATSSNPQASFIDPIAINHWEISKSKNITSIIITNGSGQKGQIWIDGSCKLVHPPEGTGFYVDEDPPDRDRFRLDFGKYGYCHGSWISSENYVGKVKFNGSEALYFCEPKPPKVTSLKSATQSPIKEAWVDIKSRTPMYIKENGLTYSYKMLPPPLLLQFPIEAKNYLTKRAEAMKPFTTEIKHHP